MTNNLIHRPNPAHQPRPTYHTNSDSRANTLWEIPVVQRRGVTVPRDTRLVADRVEFVGGDSGADEGCCVFEDFTGELRGSERGGAERESG